MTVNKRFVRLMLLNSTPMVAVSFVARGGIVLLRHLRNAPLKIRFVNTVIF